MESGTNGRGRQAIYGGSARNEFARRLGALHRAAGSPSLRNVAMLAQQRAQEAGEGRSALASVQRISDWMTGRNVPARFESLQPVLQVLILRARRRAGTPSDAVNLRAWRALWSAARAAPADNLAGTARSPYPDAPGYREEHEAVFFGRRRALVALLEMVRTSSSPERAADIIVVTGASGVGKTALLRAGLAPALNSESGGWSVAYLTPGSDPLAALGGAFSAAPNFAASDADLEHVRQASGARRPLVIVDQFERLFRPDVPAAVLETFLIRLKRLTRIGSVLIALRADHLLDCARYPWLADAVQHNSFTVNPMRRHELVAAIVGPPRTHGVAVDPGVVELMVTALEGERCGLARPAAEAGALPALAATTRALWAAHTGKRLDVSAYRRIGGVAGVLGRHADNVWEALSDSEQRDARQILTALVTVHRDGSIIRRRIAAADLDHLAARTVNGPRLVERLVHARLITREPRFACLSHDALLDWDLLLGWIADNRAALLWRQRIEDDAAEWESAGRDPGLLYRSVRLTTAINHSDPTLSVVATAFLRTSARTELGGAHDYQDVGSR
ncbi:AAA family ATPase [Nocardia terpenica]|uniref:Novel STAND NTPase 1 domain-containing protein n=1 Tax=Nocardia terpenica TaxID=455432 RepID=A0A6G9YW19_9NOCA|nr:ATP-binding protein [Nocardia terpenica]QIS17539.1 hypothetical protein F6W96_03700 [Nocardia terpenica]